jgi:hypothetical protein
MMRLATRNNGGLVLCATHAALNQEVEAPFDVRRAASGFELWAWETDDADDMSLVGTYPDVGKLLTAAAVRLPPEWRP